MGEKAVHSNTHLGTFPYAEGDFGLAHSGVTLLLFFGEPSSSSRGLTAFPQLHSGPKTSTDSLPILWRRCLFVPWLFSCLLGYSYIEQVD